MKMRFSILGVLLAFLLAGWAYAADTPPSLRMVVTSTGAIQIEPDLPDGYWSSGVVMDTSSGKSYIMVFAVGKIGEPGKQYVYTVPWAPTDYEGLKPRPGPKPNPTPGPIPNPKPSPGPTDLKAAWCIVIEESADRARDAKVANAWINRDVQTALATAGIKGRLADKDALDETGQPAKDLAPWVARAGTGLPHVFWIAADGTMIADGVLPSTAAEMIAAIKLYGGAK